MKRLGLVLAALAALALPSALAAQSAPPAEEQTLEAQIRRISERLHPVDGDVRLPQANAVLHLGEDYYFLPADEAQLVLTEAWGNPPEAVQGVLGMVFPAGRTFADDSWGAVITYTNSGHVSDEDAASVDYDALLQEMRSSEDAANEEGRRQGFPAQHLVGWAQAPVYDGRAHSLVWARNIRFEGASENTLNYDVRLLGREGVLSLNLVTVMSKLDETRAAAQRFAAAAEFVPGSRYADFRPGTDRMAEYGIGGLIAAGAGAAAAKKAGLLALLLGFGKKFIVLLAAGAAAAFAAIRRLFGGRQAEADEASTYFEPEWADEAAAPGAAGPATPEGVVADPPPPRENG